jgi:hypothetical protein
MIKVKNHLFTQGEINDVQVDKMLQKTYPNGIDICYTDPPWGTGNLKYWKTMNAKMTGADSGLINQFELEDRVVQLITSHVNNYAFIVYGVREAESIIAKLRENKKVKDVQYYEKTYPSGNRWLKNCVICVTLNDAPIIDFSVLENKKGLLGLKIVCEMFKDKYNTCLELFVGIGHYLKVLDEYGFVVVGNELNKKRLSTAISKIEK